MKSKLLKATLALMATAWVGGVQAQAPNFGTEEVVSEETTWVFNGDSYTVSDTETKNNSVNEKLYNRSATSGRGFKFSPLATPTELTFEDGYHVTVNKIATGIACSWDKTEAKSMTAGAAGDTYKNKMTPFFAFNVSVAGTCYAYVKAGMKSDSSVKDFRINFGKADGSTEISNISSGNCSSNSLTQIKYTCTEAGVFFLGSTAALDTPYEIYAIRFVPTEGKADKIVYIGATGYATYGSVDGNSYTLPAGLKAYGAKASADNHSVELTESTTGIKKTKAYILKGAPRTNYRLTINNGETSDPTNSTLERAKDAVNFTVDDKGFDSNTSKYYYILAADGDVAKFFAVANGSTLAKGKAYLQTDAQLTPHDGAGSRGVSIVFADEATGIETVQSSKLKVQGYYNLTGQRVEKPTKGLYIVNGKKIMVK